MRFNLFKPSTWSRKKKEIPLDHSYQERKTNPDAYGEPIYPAGRVSEPDTVNDIKVFLKDLTSMVTPSFRTDLIPLLRDLYKVNPDMAIAIQDMFKLANTGHKIEFPNNTPEEAKVMREHIEKASKKWCTFYAGMDGIINKMIVQCLISGAISLETPPTTRIDGVNTILFINPDDIKFKRSSNGRYHPYQKNKRGLWYGRRKERDLIKLNLATYKYIGMYGDTDEPYGIPPFLAALDSIKTQADMRVNFKQIMELLGLIGFVEVLMEKDSQRANESDKSYERRLTRQLRELKVLMKDSIKDGVVTGYKDDHEIKLSSTTANLQNVDKMWDMNQQSVANGLGVNGNIIGVNKTQSEGAAGTMLSKLISQLKNIHLMLNSALDFIYSNELLLAGFNNKGMKITFNNTTVTDDIKYQQGQEYKIRNNSELYKQGIIDQNQYAYNMGYDEPAEKEPRVPLEGLDDTSTSAAKRSREADKDKSDRKTRDKNSTSGKRKDTDTKER